MKICHTELFSIRWNDPGFLGDALWSFTMSDAKGNVFIAASQSRERPHGLKIRSDPHGTHQARIALGRQMFAITRILPSETAKSFSEFQSQAFAGIQDWIIDRARHGFVYVPSNHVEQIFTKAFLVRLGRAIHGSRRAQSYGLKEFLCDNWESEKLHTLEWAGVTLRVNRALKKEFTEVNVRKTADRIGLFLSHGPGPKPRS